MIRELRKIQVDWALTIDELSRMSHAEPTLLNKYLQMTQEAWEQTATVPAGLEGASTLVSVFKSLQKLRPAIESQREWLQQPNTILENQIPLQVMLLSPQHLAWVSYTLDSAVRQENL
jgi:hypothetical protein